MPVKINSLSIIKNRLGINDDGKVSKFAIQTCYRYMEPYVPMRDNNLRRIVSFDNNSVTYESPYASYQYFGKRQDGSRQINPENYTTAGTGTYWDKRMISADIDKVVKEIEKYMGVKK